MILNALSVQVPCHVVGNFVHGSSDIAAAAVHMRSALHADPIG